MSVVDWLLDLGGASIYAAHSICLTNDPVLKTLYVAGHMTTALSYFVIGATLFYYRVSTIRMSQGALTLYGTFIGLCGLNHTTITATMFWGIYRLDIIVVGLMAAVSVKAAWVTFFETRRSAATDHP